MSNYTLVSREDLAEIRKYHDGLRLKNKVMEEALKEIVEYEKHPKANYKQCLESVKNTARKAYETQS